MGAAHEELQQIRTRLESTSAQLSQLQKQVSRTQQNPNRTKAAPREPPAVHVIHTISLNKASICDICLHCFFLNVTFIFDYMQ